MIVMATTTLVLCCMRYMTYYVQTQGNTWEKELALMQLRNRHVVGS